MSNSKPDQRIVERIRGQPDGYEYSDVFVVIPFVYAVGLAVWWLLGIQLHLAMGGSSLLAVGVLVDALFLNPPTL